MARSASSSAWLLVGEVLADARRTRRRRSARRCPGGGRWRRAGVPTATSSSSPVSWPRPSLTILKRSRSRNSTATIDVAVVASRASAASSRSTASARFGRSVSVSWSARWPSCLRVRGAVERRARRGPDPLHHRTARHRGSRACAHVDREHAERRRSSSGVRIGTDQNARKPVRAAQAARSASIAGYRVAVSMSAMMTGSKRALYASVGVARHARPALVDRVDELGRQRRRRDAAQRAPVVGVDEADRRRRVADDTPRPPRRSRRSVSGIGAPGEDRARAPAVSRAPKVSIRLALGDVAEVADDAADRGFVQSGSCTWPRSTATSRRRGGTRSSTARSRAGGAASAAMARARPRSTSSGWIRLDELDDRISRRLVAEGPRRPTG